MTKVKIVEVDGEKVAIATVEFNLGKVHKDEVSEDGKTRTMAMGMNIEGMINFYEQLIFDKARNNDWNGYREALDQYAIFKLNHTIGVESTPIKFNDNGDDIEGLHEDVEVILK